MISSAVCHASYRTVSKMRSSSAWICCAHCRDGGSSRASWSRTSVSNGPASTPCEYSEYPCEYTMRQPQTDRVTLSTAAGRLLHYSALVDARQVPHGYKLREIVWSPFK